MKYFHPKLVLITYNKTKVVIPPVAHIHHCKEVWYSRDKESGSTICHQSQLSTLLGALQQLYV